MSQHFRSIVHEPSAQRPSPPSPIIRPTHPFDHGKVIPEYPMLPSPIIPCLGDNNVWPAHSSLLPSGYLSEDVPLTPLLDLVGLSEGLQGMDLAGSDGYDDHWAMNYPSLSPDSYFLDMYHAFNSPSSSSGGSSLEFSYSPAEQHMSEMALFEAVEIPFYTPSMSDGTTSIPDTQESNETDFFLPDPSPTQPLTPPPSTSGRQPRERKAISPSNRRSRSAFPKIPRISRAPLPSGDDAPIVTRSRLSVYPGLPTYADPTPDGSYICTVCPPGRKKRVFRREADYKRHMGSHFPDSRVSFICCGVPLELSDDPRYQEKLGGNVLVKTFYGQQMVGGCGKLLSRKDALKRHLELSTHCVGDPVGHWYSKKDD
ncbi:hypothetical protein BDY19DRAFT_995752 [Irpex rosettiformis]|uniref:Uncharacterized protein n=1 Tax=Irpex rosettiformis TaxID=378272 RepID=A0ACB8TWQ7_9APHY|nr:hypothetical protein BDY19DRAFT_995752 [Irpex rosettiformis]